MIHISYSDKPHEWITKEELLKRHPEIIAQLKTHSKNRKGGDFFEKIVCPKCKNTKINIKKTEGKQINVTCKKCGHSFFVSL